MSLAAAPRRLPDPLVDADMDGVARPLADRLAELRLDGQPVRAVALRHERALERLAVDRAADLHEPARAEELRRVVHHNARPRTWVVALLKPGGELSQHDTETLAYDRTDRRAGRLRHGIRFDDGPAWTDRHRAWLATIELGRRTAQATLADACGAVDALVHRREQLERRIVALLPA